MTTVLDVARQTQTILRGGTRPMLNKLQSAVDADDTALVLTYDTHSVGQGSILAFDLELVFVWEWNAGTKTATIERGYGATRPAAHLAGTLVEVNDRFPLPTIVEAMHSEIKGWPASIYRTESESYLVGYSDQTIPLNQDWWDAYGVIDARRSPDTTVSVPTDSWPQLTYCSLVKDMPADAFYGQAFLRIPPLGFAGRINVTVALPYPTLPWSATTNLELQLGLGESMIDLLRAGAMYRLFPFAAIATSDRHPQGEARLASEVPPGSTTGDQDRVERQYQRRLRDEAMRCLTLHPLRW